MIMITMMMRMVLLVIDDLLQLCMTSPTISGNYLDGVLVQNISLKTIVKIRRASSITHQKKGA